MKNRLLVNALILVVMAMLAVGCQKDYETLHAELVDGETFCKNIPAKATSVVFECNSSYDKRGINLSSRSSPVPVFGHLEGEVWCVTTRAGFLDANPNSRKMFYNRSGLTSIKFGSGFNTSNVTDMSGMFQGTSMKSLDVSHFNTTNVTDMSAMFSFCGCLKSIDLSNFNTSNVTNMEQMFSHCNNITNINVSNFNTSNVTSMKEMFNYCPILKVLNLSSFNTSKVNNMQQMFITCYEIIELNLSNFDMSNLGYCSDGLTYSGKEDMCLLLSRYSGQCRITCTLPTQRALESGTKLGVSVTWVRP